MSRKVDVQSRTNRKRYSKSIHKKSYQTQTRGAARRAAKSIGF